MLQSRCLVSASLRLPGRAAIRERATRQPRAMAALAVAAPTGASKMREREALIPGMLRWVAICNNGAEAAAAGRFVELACGGATVGYLRSDFAARLTPYADVFQKAKPDNITTSSSSNGPSMGRLELHPSLDTPEARTAALAHVLAALRDMGEISGWRDELYPASRSFHDAPAFLIERAAAPHFGIKAYGVHINGYVTRPDGSKELWVARRSHAKPTWPGKLDHIVAGGQPHGLSCAENVIKECEEEASIPASLAAAAVPVGAVSYTSLQQAGLKRDVLFCYDLELPENFVPQPQDGEVEEFSLLPLDDVARLIAQTDSIKDNCNLVMADFLIRHGYLTPDMRGYLELLSGLRQGDCS